MDDITSAIAEHRTRIGLLEQALKRGQSTVEGVRSISDMMMDKLRANTKELCKVGAKVEAGIEEAREKELLMLKKQRNQMVAILGTLATAAGGVGLMVLEWFLTGAAGK